MIQHLNLDKGPQMKSMKHNHVVLSVMTHVWSQYMGNVTKGAGGKATLSYTVSVSSLGCMRPKTQIKPHPHPSQVFNYKNKTKQGTSLQDLVNWFSTQRRCVVLLGVLTAAKAPLLTHLKPRGLPTKCPNLRHLLPEVFKSSYLNACIF